MGEPGDADRRDIGSPAERVAQAVQRWGECEVVRRCARLLGGRLAAPTGDDGELAMVLGGVIDSTWLAGGKPPGHAYWARVWAARALLDVWDASAQDAVVSALDDPQWRVREMALKAIAQRQVPAADRTAGLVQRCVVAGARGSREGAGSRRRGRAR